MSSKNYKLYCYNQKAITRNEPAENPKTIQAIKAATINTQETRNVATFVSEKIQSSSFLFTLYLEFKKIVSKYDEEVRKTLTPLMITMLECINTANHVNKDYNFKIEILKEDNKQLEKNTEKLRRLKNLIEERYSSYKEVSEKDRNSLLFNLEAARSKIHLFELRHKNIIEYARVIEERERKLQREYDKLLSKYTNLFRVYVTSSGKTQLPEPLQKDLKIIKEHFATKSQEEQKTLSTISIITNISDENELKEPGEQQEVTFNLEKSSMIVSKDNPSFLMFKLCDRISDIQQELKVYKKLLANNKSDCDHVMIISKSNGVCTKADMEKSSLIKSHFYIGVDNSMEWSQILDTTDWIVDNYCNCHFLVLPTKLETARKQTDEIE